MRGLVSGIRMVRPTSLGAALSQLAEEPGCWRAFAGGTDLMVEHEAGRHEKACWMSLDLLEELQQLRVEEAQLRIGAGVTYRQLLESDLDLPEMTMLRESARLTGARAVQARGTLGGNLANASPAADTVPVLIALGASLEIVSARETRQVEVDRFFLEYRRTELSENELIREIAIPLRPRRVNYFRKVGTRRAQAISKVVFAASATPTPAGFEYRIALGSVAPIPLRCRDTEKALGARRPNDADRKQARRALLSEIRPIDDIRSTAEYRRRVGANLLEAFLRRVEDSEA